MGRSPIRCGLMKQFLRANKFSVPLWSHITIRRSLASRHTQFEHKKFIRRPSTVQLPLGRLTKSLVLRFQSNGIMHLIFKSQFHQQHQVRKSNFSPRRKFPWIIFRRIFKVIWGRVKYTSRHFKQNCTTLNYTLHYYTALCSNMTSRKKKGRCHRKRGDAFKVF